LLFLAFFLIFPLRIIASVFAPLFDPSFSSRALAELQGLPPHEADLDLVSLLPSEGRGEDAGDLESNW